jgi:hypothetical protein
MFHLILVLPGFPGLSQWHILEKFQISGDKASPCFRPFGIGKLSHKRLPIRTSQYFSCKHILISHTTFVNTPNSVRLLYNISVLTELRAFLKSTFTENVGFYFPRGINIGNIIFFSCSWHLKKDESFCIYDKDL